MRRPDQTGQGISGIKNWTFKNILYTLGLHKAWFVEQPSLINEILNTKQKLGYKHNLRAQTVQKVSGDSCFLHLFIYFILKMYAFLLER